MQYNLKIDILCISRESDGMGGWTEAPAIIHQDVPCRINWSRGSEKIFFDKNTYFRDGKVYCGVINADVKNIVQYNGVNYEIVNISNVDEMNRYMILEIRLIQ